MNKQEKVLIEGHFGPDARIERRPLGGYRVIAPFGEVEIKDDGFQNIVGDGEMYQATLLFARERWGTVKVSGPAQHVMACMAHAKELGIEVVPQGEPGDGAFVFAACMACLGFFWGLLFGLFFDNPLDGGLILGAISGVLAKALMDKVNEKDAKRIGQQYRDIFPDTYGSERRANYETARRKGLL